LSKDLKAELREIVALLAKEDPYGNISSKYLKTILRALGFAFFLSFHLSAATHLQFPLFFLFFFLFFVGRTPSERELRAFQEKYAPDGFLTLENIFDIFRTFDTMRPKESETNIREAFAVYDYGQDGRIYSKDVFHIMTRMGGANKLTKEEVSRLLNEFDSDIKGRMQTEEIWFGDPPHNLFFSLPRFVWLILQISFPSNAMIATLIP
jgi:Ca2+-binding EF-hand superfamily protein